MKNITSIMAALVLSMAFAGSAFAAENEAGAVGKQSRKQHRAEKMEKRAEHKKKKAEKKEKQAEAMKKADATVPAPAPTEKK